MGEGSDVLRGREIERGREKGEGGLGGEKGEVGRGSGGGERKGDPCLGAVRSHDTNVEFNANASKDWRNSLLRVKLTLKIARDLICIKRRPLQEGKRARKNTFVDVQRNGIHCY